MKLVMWEAVNDKTEYQPGDYYVNYQGKLLHLNTDWTWAGVDLDALAKALELPSGSMAPNETYGDF